MSLHDWLDDSENESSNFQPIIEHKLKNEACYAHLYQPVPAQFKITSNSKDILWTDLLQYNTINQSFVSNITDTVDVFCTIHGLQKEVMLNNIMRGKNACPKCVSDIKCVRWQKLLDKKFGYSRYIAKEYISLVIGKVLRPHLVILCTEHLEYFTMRTDHITELSDLGCQKCQLSNTSGYRVQQPGSLYLLVIDTHIKFGITNLSISKRYSAKDRDKIDFHKVFHSSNGKDALYIETELKSIYKDNLKQTKDIILESATGNTELIYNRPDLIELIKSKEFKLSDLGVQEKFDKIMMQIEEPIKRKRYNLFLSEKTI